MKNIFSYLSLMRLNKPVGIFLLLWPTLMALWIASKGKPNSYVMGIFILGVIVMRSAGCVINDIADRKFDKAVSRTKNRPLVTGALQSKQALILFLFLLGVAFLLVLQLNFLTIKLSVATAALAIIYPLMKRYTYLPQLILGAAYGSAVLMAFTAVMESIPSAALLLYAATICWAIVYDTEYAMVDRAEDIIIGVKSTAIWLGKFDQVAIGILQAIVLGLLAKLGSHLGLSWIYFMGWGLAALLAGYQQYLIKDRDRELCFKAFLNNQWFVAVLFMGLALDYYVHGLNIA